MHIQKDEILYENYTNYLYKIESGKYILFNPSIHYWICLDEISYEIYETIKEWQTVNQVREKLGEKYGISEDVFQEDVMPIIEYLIKSRFLTNIPTTKEAKWMSQPINIEDIKRYPFNDIYISLADECNLHCIYCFNRENRKERLLNKENKSLTKEKIIEVLEEFKALGGTGVIFTGGEPTLNKDLLVLCKIAKRIGLNPTFITNGTTLGTLNLEELFESVQKFGISLDSVVQEEINKLWGTSSVVLENTVLRSLDQINEWARQHRMVEINMMPVVTAVNLKSLRKLVRHINERLDCCKIHWMITQYSILEKEEIDKQLEISEEAYMCEVVESLKGLYDKDVYVDHEAYEKKINEINLYTLSNAGKLIPSSIPKVLTCAPSFFIANNGDVYPCQGFEKDENCLGNVWDINLEQAFNGKAFYNTRQQVIKNNDEFCKDCELRFACERKCVGCNTFYEMDRKQCKLRTIQRLYLMTQLS